MLFDDPFGAVDAPTAMALLDRLLLGPMLRGKTRVPSAEWTARPSAFAADGFALEYIRRTVPSWPGC